MSWNQTLRAEWYNVWWKLPTVWGAVDQASKWGRMAVATVQNVIWGCPRTWCDRILIISDNNDDCIILANQVTTILACQLDATITSEPNDSWELLVTPDTSVAIWRVRAHEWAKYVPVPHLLHCNEHMKICVLCVAATAASVRDWTALLQTHDIRLEAIVQHVLPTDCADRLAARLQHVARHVGVAI
jgi:hypothetical protein